MIEIRRILCPTDLSEFSRRAFAHAVVLGRWYGAQLEALYVVPQLLPHPGTVVSYPSWVALNPGVREQILDEVKRSLQAAEAAGVKSGPSIREGDTVGEILKEAAALPADLIVMGSHGRGGFERWVLGSVAEKVLRKSPCPVMTVGQGVHHEPPHTLPVFKRVLCPLDFSDASCKALRYALSLAEEADAELTLLHVLEWFPESPEQADRAVPGYRGFLEDDARKRLARAVPDEARDWCKPVELVVHGKAYREILRVAQERETQLIVMGVHGRSAMDVMLFGSTTHHVVRGSACPVLTIRGA